MKDGCARPRAMGILETMGEGRAHRGNRARARARILALTDAAGRPSPELAKTRVRTTSQEPRATRAGLSGPGGSGAREKCVCGERLCTASRACGAKPPEARRALSECRPGRHRERTGFPSRRGTGCRKTGQGAASLSGRRPCMLRTCPTPRARGGPEAGAMPSGPPLLPPPLRARGPPAPSCASSGGSPSRSARRACGGRVCTPCRPQGLSGRPGLCGPPGPKGIRPKLVACRQHGTPRPPNGRGRTHDLTAYRWPAPTRAVVRDYARSHGCG